MLYLAMVTFGVKNTTPYSIATGRLFDVTNVG